MRRVFLSLAMAAAVPAASHGPLPAQVVGRFTGPYGGGATPALTDPAGGPRPAGWEQRLEGMQRQHQRELQGLRGRITELERRLQQAAAQPSPDVSQPRELLSPEQETELEVERLLREAEGGPQAPPPDEGGPLLQPEEDIESLLRAAEERRAEAAPELGAGLGARLSAFNPNISVIGNFLGVLSSAPDSFEQVAIPLGGFDDGNVDGFGIGEMELLMTAAIDPYADGLLKLAFLEEGVELEEGYILFHDYPFRDRLPFQLRDVEAKLGVFRMAFGPMNLVDCHDLPSVDRPLAIQRFLGDEGLIRAGVSVSKVIPLSEPWGSELTVEFASGEPPGHGTGAPPVAGIDHPLGLVHYKVFREREPLPGSAEWLHGGGRRRARYGYRSLELGATFAATGTQVPEDSEHLYSLVQGVDLTWQWYDPRPDNYRQYLLQAEVFVGELDQQDDGVRGDVGAYLLGQARLTRRWFTGLRFDITEFPECDGLQLGGTTYLTYFFTEFNRARLQYQYLWHDMEGRAGYEMEGVGSENAHTVWFQLVFAFGAHPPEPYYITQRF